jgi:hypothetical protein
VHVRNEYLGRISSLGVLLTYFSDDALARKPGLESLTWSELVPPIGIDERL